ncbi:MAG: carboxypeptidase-like regulatory domain-containing protein [Cyclobacteriaceae bacterium]
MRVLQIVILLLFCGQLSHAQEILKKDISINTESTFLKDALSQIEQAADVKFVYDPGLIPLRDPIYFNKAKFQLGELFETLFKSRDIKYDILPDNTYIVLSRSRINTGTIYGKILDAKTLDPLPYGNVFINATTRGTATSESGEFEIGDIPFGKVELVISYVGYRTAKVEVTVSSPIVNVGNLSLAPEEQILEDVNIEAKRDRKWDKELKKFERIFLGTDDIAASCKIVNPWVLDFSTKEHKKQLTAYANEPLEIENSALGYRILFYLTEFWKDAHGYLIGGKVKFDEMVPLNDEQQKVWLGNREEAYIGSSQHLFKSIIARQIRANKFFLYTERKEYENAVVRSQYFEEELKHVVVPLDTGDIVFPGEIPNTFKIVLRGRVEVHNHNEKAIVRTYRDIGYRVSWLRVENDTLIVNRDGVPLDPTAVTTSGDMNAERVAHMLPTDYERNLHRVEEVGRAQPNLFEPFYEKPYIHTDKPYYYQGERIWFKVYVNFTTPEWRDSLSHTLHVELINEKREIVQSKKLRLDSGMTHGNFLLPIDISDGMHYLRAYTSLARNFGDGNLYVKSIPVLDLNDRIVPPQKDDGDLIISGVTVTSEKREYSKREKINLRIRLQGEHASRSADVSVSVTDSKQVIPIEGSTILRDYEIEINQLESPSYLQHPVERGLNLRGQYQKESGQKGRLLLNAMEWYTKELFLVETDAEGYFELEDLYLYDTALFTFKEQSVRQEDSKARLLPVTPPSADFYAKDFKLKLERTATPQRIYSDFERPNDVLVLDEVVIEDSKIDDARLSRPYGIARQVNVIKKEEIRKEYGNLNYSLVGRVPGLLVQQHEGKWKITITRASGLGLSSVGPLVTINDVPMAGNAGDIISMVDPETVESIEVSKSINVMYGTQGVGGVISIYTKSNTALERVKDQFTPLQTLKFRGYATPKEFKAPNYDLASDHDQVDLRSTLYWNPNISVDSNGSTVSFYAADLQTQYRVIVEGVDSENQPVRAEYYFSIKN